MGGSPEEVSYDFYHPITINYISFFIYTNQTGIFFDFSSMELSKDAYFVIECFKKIFSHQEFQILGIKEIIVWSDVGKHFRNSMLSYFLAHLPQTHSLKAIHNFFVECHSKNICDVHFSQVSFFSLIII